MLWIGIYSNVNPRAVSTSLLGCRFVLSRSHWRVRPIWRRDGKRKTIHWNVHHLDEGNAKQELLCWTLRSGCKIRKCRLILCQIYRQRSEFGYFSPNPGPEKSWQIYIGYLGFIAPKVYQLYSQYLSVTVTQLKQKKKKHVAPWHIIDFSINSSLTSPDCDAADKTVILLLGMSTWIWFFKLMWY